MTYRSILVHVDNSAAAKTRIAAAAALAFRQASVLTGVFLKSETAPNTMSDGITGLPLANVEAFFIERAKHTAECEREARLMFEEVARSAGVETGWMSVNGDSEFGLVACARRHDLAVLPVHMKAPLGHSTLTAAQVAMGAGGPVLVLKHGGYPVDFGKRVLVAWNDSREAVRALRDAWPFLEAADMVYFLTIAGVDERHDDRLLRRQLESHGCRRFEFIVDRNDSPAPDLIRRQIGALGADLVVMGLYGHSRLQQFILGGVSRDLLQDAPMPLLVSH